MRYFSRVTAVVFAGTVFAIAGCNKGPQDGVVATVNGHPIQRTEVDKEFQAQVTSNPQQNASNDQSDAMRLQILQGLIGNELVTQRATKLNLTATDAEVDAKLAEMKAPYTEDQFQAKLKASNLTLDDLKLELKRSLTQNKLINKEIDSKITVTDADITNYFNAHKAEFNILENQYHLAMIQVTNQVSAQQPGNLQGSKATNDDEARKKIQAIKNRIDAGEDFGMLASNFSENAETAANGGDIGFVKESQIKAEPVAFAAISKLKAGESTEIIPIQNAQHQTLGYSIYKLISKDNAGQRDLNDPRVQQAIRQQLHDSRSQLLKSAYFEMLHDQAKIQNFLAEQIFKNAAQ